jgi:NADH-quinone oxidoreductase subunit A
MLKAYLPALVFLFLGLAVGTAFTFANRVLGPRRPTRVKREPYESGLPSDVRRSFRFGVSFYLVGMLFIIFDMEVVLLYPTAIVMGESAFALGAISLFIFFLAVAFVYEWGTGALDWNDAPTGGTRRQPSKDEQEDYDGYESNQSYRGRDHARGD